MFRNKFPGLVSVPVTVLANEAAHCQVASCDLKGFSLYFLLQQGKCDSASLPARSAAPTEVSNTHIGLFFSVQI